MTGDIALLVQGRRFDTWVGLSISHSLEAAAGTIDVQASSPADWTLTGLEPLEVLYDDTPVFRGNLDTVEINLSLDAHDLSASGRSLTGDLVDSSVDLETMPSELVGQSILEIVRTYGRLTGFLPLTGGRRVPVPIDTDLNEQSAPVIDRFGIQPGETQWDAIERACRRAGVLATTRGNGRLFITRAGNKRAIVDLHQGVNVLTLNGRFDNSARFHTYTVIGQSSPTDEFNGTVTTAPSGAATDVGVRPRRKLVVVAEGQVDGEVCLRRAQWEASIRAARAARVTVEVQGWTQTPDGPLWEPNLLVPVDLPAIRYRGDMLVESVALNVDSQGRRAVLGLVRPDAYTLLAELPQAEDPGRSLLSDYEWEDE